MEAKKAVIRIFSVILAIASIFVLLFGVQELKDSLSAKAYWEKTGEEAAAQFDMLEGGIRQLKENETTYTEGVEAYEAGQDELAAGQADLAAGAAKLAAGEAELAAGQSSYDENAALLSAGEQQYQQGLAELEEGKRQVEEGKQRLAEGYAAYEAGQAEVAAGEAELAANQAAYEEGKAQLAQVEPIYTAAKAAESEFNQKQADYDAAVARGDFITAAILEKDVQRAQIAMNTSLGGYSMGGIISEYEDGQAKIAAYEAGQARVAEGRAQLAAAEQQLAAGEAEVAAGEAKVAEGQAKLDAARKQLDDGYAQLAAGADQLNAGQAELNAGYADYAAGQARLAEGTQKLADGLAQLNVYEGGQLQVVEGLDLVIGTDTYYNAAGDALVVSIAKRLGPGFSYWAVDENGQPVYLNGERFLDLDKALEVVAAGRAFLADTTDVVTKEITGRVEIIALVAGASILGLLAALIGLIPKRIGTMILAVLCAVAAGAAIAFLVIDGGEFPMCAIAGAVNAGLLGLTLRTALIILAAVALVHTIVAGICNYGAAPVAAVTQPGAGSASAAPVEPVSGPVPPVAPAAPAPAPAAPSAPAIDTTAMAAAFAAFMQSDAFKEAIANATKPQDGENS